MRQLDAGHRALSVDKLRDARQHFDVLVFPDSEVSRRNAPFGRDRGGLDHDQTCSADRPTPEMNKVPITGEAVHHRILAHRRHGNSVVCFIS
jgi:hypothetical protein